MKTLPLHPANQIDGALAGLIENIATRLAEESRAEISLRITEEIAKLGTHIIERPMDSKAAAAYLTIHANTLLKWINDGVLPPSVVHKTTTSTYFFFPSELRDFIKSL